MQMHWLGQGKEKTLNPFFSFRPFFHFSQPQNPLTHEIWHTCHIVSEKWVKHYSVSFEYPGPSPSLKGAGDNDLPVKGVVDLEFKVGKTKITMKRVVVVGIPLNVISTYALLETGWKTVLGNAEESGLFLKKLKNSFEDF